MSEPKEKTDSHFVGENFDAILPQLWEKAAADSLTAVRGELEQERIANRELEDRLARLESTERALSKLRGQSIWEIACDRLTWKWKSRQKD